MPRYEESVVIARRPEDVFAYMDDVAREREWQPNIREAAQDPPGAGGVGTRKRYVSEFLGKRFVNVYVTTEYEPCRRVAYESTPDSSLRARGTFTWEPVAEGTRVTMAVETEPPALLRLLPQRLVDARSRSELRGSLERVKRILEGR